MGPMFDQLQASPPIAPEQKHLLENSLDSSMGMSSPVSYSAITRSTSPHQLNPVVEPSAQHNSPPTHALLSIMSSSAEAPLASL